MMNDFRFDPLWLKLNFLDLGQNAAFQPFLQMLGQQTGWPLPLVSQVMEEYRRFLFLALRAGHPVTPPAMIEKVWTLHMQMAKNYWEQLGSLIAERPVAQGLGPASAASMAEQYQQTLASYARIFGMEPPADIWGKEPPKEDPFKPFTDYWKRLLGLDRGSGF
jgi:hypothetical protein